MCSSLGAGAFLGSTGGFVAAAAVVVVVGAGVVVITGQPICSSFSASVIPSEQQPNKLPTHSASGHPLLFLPSAGDTPSGQHPCLVSAQVSGTGHPSSNGPVAAVVLSEQQPNADFKQAETFGLGLHFFGVCSFVMMASSVFGVLPYLSSSSSVWADPSVVDQMSTVVPSTSESVVTDDSVDAAASVVSVASVSSVPSDVAPDESDDEDVTSVPSSEEAVELSVDSVAPSDVNVDESKSEDVVSSEDDDAEKSGKIEKILNRFVRCDYSPEDDEEAGDESVDSVRSLEVPLNVDDSAASDEDSVAPCWE